MNPWKFAQSTCRPPQKVDPNFSAEQCLLYFESIASTPARYSGFPDWIQEIWPLSDHEYDFDMSPIHPCEVQCALKKCSSTSAPGIDNITYFHLKKLPSCHLFLATLHSNILILLPKVGAKGKPYYFIRKGTHPFQRTSAPLP